MAKIDEEQRKLGKNYLFQGQSMDWSINAGFADKEVMVNHRYVILCQLHIYTRISQSKIRWGKWLFFLYIPNYMIHCQPKDIEKKTLGKEKRKLTSTYDAPRFAAAINDCQGQKYSIPKRSNKTNLDGILAQLQWLATSQILSKTYTNALGMHTERMD